MCAPLDSTGAAIAIAIAFALAVRWCTKKATNAHLHPRSRLEMA